MGFTVILASRFIQSLVKQHKFAWMGKRDQALVSSTIYNRGELLDTRSVKVEERRAWFFRKYGSNYCLVAYLLT
uniref:Uncharacterized protein n=1 Tax=Onchocerca volvulus TaxID=6282 RepID=A0A8R1XWH1_ONCVO